MSGKIAMIDRGTVNAADLDLFCLTDDVDEAVRHVIQWDAHVDTHRAE